MLVDILEVTFFISSLTIQAYHIDKLEKSFQKPIAAFSNSTDFILDLFLYDYVCLVSCFGLECLDFEESSYSQLPGNLSPDYKYLHARQIPHQLSFSSQTIPDCIRYIIDVFCYSFRDRPFDIQGGVGGIFYRDKLFFSLFLHSKLFFSKVNCNKFFFEKITH